MLVCDQRGGIRGRRDFGAAGQGAYAGRFSVCGAKVSRAGYDAASDVCAVYAVDDARWISGFAARFGGGAACRERGGDSVGESAADTAGCAVVGVEGSAVVGWGGWC